MSKWNYLISIRAQLIELSEYMLPYGEYDSIDLTPMALCVLDEICYYEESPVPLDGSVGRPRADTLIMEFDVPGALAHELTERMYNLLLAIVNQHTPSDYRYGIQHRSIGAGEFLLEIQRYDTMRDYYSLNHPIKPEEINRAEWDSSR